MSNPLPYEGRTTSSNCSRNLELELDSSEVAETLQFYESTESTNDSHEEEENMKRILMAAVLAYSSLSPMTVFAKDDVQKPHALEAAMAAMTDGKYDHSGAVQAIYNQRRMAPQRFVRVSAAEGRKLEIDHERRMQAFEPGTYQQYNCKSKQVTDSMQYVSLSEYSIKPTKKISPQLLEQANQCLNLRLRLMYTEDIARLKTQYAESKSPIMKDVLRLEIQDAQEKLGHYGGYSPQSTVNATATTSSSN